MNRCSVCDHERRDEIEGLLRAGKSLRLVSRATGISKDALYRHQKNHVVLALSEAIERRAEEGDGTSDDLGDLRSSLLLMLEVAMSKGDFTRATGLARELRQTLIELDKQEAARRLRGDGPTGPPTLHVVYDDPVFDTSRLTDEERVLFERLLAKVEARHEETFKSIKTASSGGDKTQFSGDENPSPSEGYRDISEGRFRSQTETPEPRP